MPVCLKRAGEGGGAASVVQWFTRWTLTWVQISLKIVNSLGGLREANNSASVIGLKNGNNNIAFHIVVGKKKGSEYFKELLKLKEIYT